MKMHTVILSAQGWIAELDSDIRYLAPEVDEIEAMWKRSEIIAKLVVACRCRETAAWCANVGRA